MLVPTEDHPGSGYRSAVLTERMIGYLNSFRMAFPVYGLLLDSSPESRERGAILW